MRLEHIRRLSGYGFTSIGLLSALCYVPLALVQRRLALNGSGGNIGEAMLPGARQDALRLALDLVLYIALNALLFALYAALVARGRRATRPGEGPWGALLPAALAHLLLLAAPPTLSFDVFSYLAHGALFLAPNGNPYFVPAAAAIELPIGPQLVSWGWRPVHGISPYGPLWTGIEVMATALAAEDVWLGMVMLKLVVVATSLGAAAVIWRIMGRLRSELRLAGTLAYLWNPVVVAELALDGHNDAPIILLTLLALWAGVASRHGLALFAALMGALTKIVPVLFVPAVLMWAWRDRGARAAPLLARVLAGFLAAVVCGVLLYLPYWAGPETFQGLVSRGGGTGVGSIRLVLFALGVLIVAWRVRTSLDLLEAAALVALGYVLIGSPDYFPWYTALPIALLALRPEGGWWTMLLILSVTARLVAPANALLVGGFIDATTETLIRALLGLALPLVVGTLLLRGRRMPRAVVRGRG